MTTRGAKTWIAAEAPGRGTTTYPDPFAERVAGRYKQALGDLFGLSGFGINRTTLLPGSQSSLLHRHRAQDEFVFVLDGELTLIDEDGEYPLGAGMCAGFARGGAAHHLVNRSEAPATYLEIGDRRLGDQADYPLDDLVAVPGATGWAFSRKSGEPY